MNSMSADSQKKTTSSMYDNSYYENLIEELDDFSAKKQRHGGITAKAADAIRVLLNYKFHSDNIVALPNCNTCYKGQARCCDFAPRVGDYCRINCAFYLGEPPEGSN